MAEWVHNHHHLVSVQAAPVTVSQIAPPREKSLRHLPLPHYPAASPTSQDAADDTFKLQVNSIGIIKVISNSLNSTL